MMPRRGTALALAVVALAPALGHASAEPRPQGDSRGEDVYLAGPGVDVTQDVPGDLIAVGGTVRVGASVAETAILAGGNVSIEGAVSDDVIAAGGEVVLRGRAADDARLAGGTVRITGHVDHDATAAGGTVRVERDAIVGGRAWLAGGDIVIAGTVGRQLRAAGRRVSIEGTVRGDVHVEADTLEIGPGARVDGDVLHRGSGEPRIDPRARIAGRVEHTPRPKAPWTRTFGVVASLLLLPALFATGAVMILLFPRFTPAAAQTLETDPWPSLGLGALALLGAPALTVALFVTGIGIPLGLILLAAYPVALLVGYLVAALFVGSAAARLLGRPHQAPPSKGALMLRLLAALVALAIVRFVPVLGGLVSFAALLFGLGALVIRMYRTYRGARSGQPPVAA